MIGKVLAGLRSMDAATTPNTVYVFGPFRFDPAHGRLTCEGRPVPLTARLRDTLRCLLENSGRLVTKDELLAVLWPGRIADEANLSQAISGLRKALGPEGEGMILTEAGRGYRFGAPVRRQTDAAQRARTKWSLGRLGWIIGLGAVALAAVAALALLMSWRPAGRPGQGLRVVLADFQNFTGDSAFDHLMGKALEVDLAQSPFLVITPGARIADTLSLMGQAKDAPLTADLARQVCERNDGGAMIAGAIGRLGDRFLVTVTTSDCTTGKILDAEKREAATKDAVPGAIDRLAEGARRKLGESEASITRFEAPLMAEKTGSFEALRAYSEGVWMHNHGRFIDAAPLFQHAIELDPKFVMAYAGLSTDYYNLKQPALDRQNIEQAYRLRSLVSEPRQLLIAERYDQSVTRDIEAAIRTLRVWTQTYPLDSKPWANLSNLENWLGRYDEAMAAGRQSLALGERNAIGYSVVMRAYRRANQLAASEAFGRDAIAKGVAGGDIFAQMMDDAYLAGDAARARQLFASAKGKSWEGEAIIEESDFAAAEGRLKQSTGLLRQAIELEHGARPDNFAAAGQALNLALVGQNDKAREIVARPTPDERSQEFILAMAEVGDVKRAEAELERELKRWPQDTLLIHQEAPQIRAALLMRQGKAAEAVAALSPAAPYQLRGYDVPYQRGYAYLAAKNPAAAANDFRLILANPGLGPDPAYPLAHLGLARALVAMGDLAGARREYKTFLAAWSNADDDLPILIAAKAENAALAVR